MGKKISELGSGVTTALDGSELFEIEKGAASGRTDLQNLKKFISPVVASGFIGDLPPASELNAGEFVFNASQPAFIGSMMQVIPGIEKFVDMASTSIFALGGDIVSGDNTDEQILCNFHVPPTAKILLGSIRFDMLVSKSSAAIGATLRVRIGVNGDATDTLIQSVSLSAATRTARILSTIFVKDSTTVISNFPMENGTDDVSQIVVPVTVPDLSDGDVQISISIQHAATGCNTTIESLVGKMN